MNSVPLEATPTIPKNRLRYILITLIFFSCFASYFNALFNGFVYDDIFQVVENRWIKNTSYLPDFFSQGVWGFAGGKISNYYRPIMHLIYMLAYHIFGLHPWGFHFVNILFHAGVSLLVFLSLLFFLENLNQPPISGSLFHHSHFITMPENPRLLNLGMNGILSERSGGLSRHVWHGRRS
jgi:hypothetical protein